MAIPYEDSINRTTAQPRFVDEIFATIALRDAYAETLRYVGMSCTVLDDGTGKQKDYWLVGGVTNAHWEEKKFGGSGSGTKNYIGEIVTSNGENTGVTGNFEDGNINGWLKGILELGLNTPYPVSITAYPSPTPSPVDLTFTDTLNLVGRGSLLVTIERLTAGIVFGTKELYVDKVDQGQILDVGFDYKYTEGTVKLQMEGTPSDHLAVTIYDLDNFKFITPINPFVFVDTEGKARTKFQTSFNGARYILMIYATRSIPPSQTGGTLVIDDVYLSPQAPASKEL